MTRRRDFKNLVRSRMRKTGESYVTALAYLLRSSPGPSPAASTGGEMRFFQPPSGPRPEQPILPVWFRPPMDQIGRPLATTAMVARSESAVVALTGLIVYATGFELALSVRLPDGLDHMVDIFGQRAVAHQEVEQIPDEVLRIGIEYPDGRRATSLDRPLNPYNAAEPELYLQLTGGGGGRGWDYKCWCWPLPPPGAFELVCEWPAKSISLTRLAVDADQIREAARHVTSLWP